MSDSSTGQGASPPAQAAAPEPGTNPLRLRRPLLLIAGLFVLIVLACGVVPRLLLTRDLRRQRARAAATAPNIFVMRAEATPADVALQLSGTLSPITEAPVLARTDGYLTKRYVDIGDRVRAGQVLAELAAPDLDQQVDQARQLLKESQSTFQQSQAALDQAKANAAIARITAERWAALVARGAVSRQANDNYQFAYSAQLAAVGVATASVGAANSSMSANAANLQHYRELQGFEQIRAPYDGVITQRNVDDGALITATSTLLFRIARNDRLRTFVDVPQLNATVIRPGEDAAIKVVQYPDRDFHATVTRTADALNLNSRTLLTEVDVDNQTGLLLPGMYATVSFELPRAVHAILIPGEALVFRADGTTVAVVEPSHTIHFHKVVVGHDYGANLEIRSGLALGDTIVVNPDDDTVEGAHVNPVFIGQAAGSPAPASGGKQTPSTENPQ